MSRAPSGAERPPPRPPGGSEAGAAVTDFVMVSGLLTLLFVAVLQLGVALHVRNTLISCASEGARLGARADASPGDGAARARLLISRAISDAYARDVSAGVETADGVQVVVVRVHAPMPVIGLLGPHDLDVAGRAFAEGQ